MEYMIFKVLLFEYIRHPKPFKSLKALSILLESGVHYITVICVCLESDFVLNLV